MAGLNLQPYQAQILRLLQGGFKAGQMSVISAGRKTGKSYYHKLLMNRIYDTNLCKEIVMPTDTEPKYKFSRAKWYTVDIGVGAWKLGREYNEIIAWCNDMFGPHPTRSDAWSRWWVGIGQIYFRDQRDFVLYQLRWS